MGTASLYDLFDETGRGRGHRGDGRLGSGRSGPNPEPPGREPACAGQLTCPRISTLSGSTRRPASRRIRLGIGHRCATSRSAIGAGAVFRAPPHAISAVRTAAAMTAHGPDPDGTTARVNDVYDLTRSPARLGGSRWVAARFEPAAVSAGLRRMAVPSPDIGIAAFAPGLSSLFGGCASGHACCLSSCRKGIF